jgi:predicted acylesterase/phospholipase RssA
VKEAASYDAVVFAGGGCRCFWQVGFWEVVAPAVGLAPKQIGAVSAGAAMACMVLSGAVEESVAYFKSRAAQNHRNAYPRNLLRREPVFPHERIYRDTILHACRDPAAVARLREGPEVRVLLARLPAWLGARSGVALGFLAYEAEKLLRPRVHPILARRAGFVSEIASLRDCRTAEEIADLILQSSCTPPFTPVYRRDARPVLDGGLIDNVPIETVDGAKETLVLLTRRYDDRLVPRTPGRTYVQPSESIPIEKWDYTSPALVDATLEIGRRDGERFVASRG